MAANPNSYEPANKNYIISIRMVGSREAMIEFWKGMRHIHNWAEGFRLNPERCPFGSIGDFSKIPEYKPLLKYPEYGDIQRLDPFFFELNTNETYIFIIIWYAYRCEHGKTLNELIPKLGTIHYDYFGGEEESIEMVPTAKELPNRITLNHLLRSFETGLPASSGLRWRQCPRAVSPKRRASTVTKDERLAHVLLLQVLVDDGGDAAT